MCFTHPARSTGAGRWTLNFNCPPPIRDMTLPQTHSPQQHVIHRRRQRHEAYRTSNDGERNAAHAHTLWYRQRHAHKCESERKWSSTLGRVMGGGEMHCSFNRNVKTPQKQTKGWFTLPVVLPMSITSVRNYVSAKCHTAFIFPAAAVSPLVRLYGS